MNSRYDKDLFFDLINRLESGSLDRKTIAEIMDISPSSAGKVVSELLSNRVVSEYIKKDSTPGRKSSVVHFRHDPIFAIIHITFDRIVVNYFGYCLNITDSETIEIKEPIFIDDTLAVLFKRLSVKTPKLCGICLLCDGYPTNGTFLGSTVHGIDTLSLTEAASEYIPNAIVLLRNSYCTYTEKLHGLNVLIAEENNSVTLHLIYNGEIISDRYIFSHITDKLRLSGGRYLSSALKYAKDFTEYVSVISEFISMVIMLVCPKEVYFSSSRYHCTHEIILLITESLILKENIRPSDLPKIIPFNITESVSDKYIRQNLRDIYLTKLFFEE